MTHTPGPWRIGKQGGTVVSDLPSWGPNGSDVDYYGGHLICESIAQANAHLIAAAPELLEALKLARSAFRGINDDGSYRGDGIVFSDDERELIETAIAKAEGGAR